MLTFMKFSSLPLTPSFFVKQLFSWCSSEWIVYEEIATFSSSNMVTILVQKNILHQVDREWDKGAELAKFTS